MKQNPYYNDFLTAAGGVLTESDDPADILLDNPDHADDDKSGYHFVKCPDCGGSGRTDDKSVWESVGSVGEEWDGLTLYFTGSDLELWGTRRADRHTKGGQRQRIVTLPPEADYAREWLEASGYNPANVALAVDKKLKRSKAWTAPAGVVQREYSIITANWPGPIREADMETVTATIKLNQTTPEAFERWLNQVAGEYDMKDVKVSPGDDTTSVKLSLKTADPERINHLNTRMQSLRYGNVVVEGLDAPTPGSAAAAKLARLLSKEEDRARQEARHAAKMMSERPGDVIDDFNTWVAMQEKVVRNLRRTGQTNNSTYVYAMAYLKELKRLGYYDSDIAEASVRELQIDMDLIKAMQQRQGHELTITPPKGTWSNYDDTDAIGAILTTVGKGLSDILGSDVYVEPINEREAHKEWDNFDEDFEVEFKCHVYDYNDNIQVGVCEVEASLMVMDSEEGWIDTGWDDSGTKQTGYKSRDDLAGVIELEVKITRVIAMSEANKKLVSVPLNEGTDLAEARSIVNKAVLQQERVVVRVEHPAMQRIAETFKQSGVVVRQALSEAGMWRVVDTPDLGFDPNRPKSVSYTVAQGRRELMVLNDLGETYRFWTPDRAEAQRTADELNRTGFNDRVIRIGALPEATVQEGAKVKDEKAGIAQAKANAKSSGKTRYVNRTTDGVRVEKSPVKDGSAGASTTHVVTPDGKVKKYKKESIDESTLAEGKPWMVRVVSPKNVDRYASDYPSFIKGAVARIVGQTEPVTDYMFWHQQDAQAFYSAPRLRSLVGPDAIVLEPVQMGNFTESVNEGFGGKGYLTPVVGNPGAWGVVVQWPNGEYEGFAAYGRNDVPSDQVAFSAEEMSWQKADRKARMIGQDYEPLDSPAALRALDRGTWNQIERDWGQSLLNESTVNESTVAPQFSVLVTQRRSSAAWVQEAKQYNATFTGAKFDGSAFNLAFTTEQEARNYMRVKEAQGVKVTGPVVIEASESISESIDEDRGLMGAIRPGDRVTIITPHGQERTGKAVMKGPHGWVLNLGGKHGTPGIANDDNIVKVKPSKKKSGHSLAMQRLMGTYENIQEAAKGELLWMTNIDASGVFHHHDQDLKAAAVHLASQLGGIIAAGRSTPQDLIGESWWGGTWFNIGSYDIQLLWGDEDSNWIRNLDRKEQTAFIKALRAALKEHEGAGSESRSPLGLR